MRLVFSLFIFCFSCPFLYAQPGNMQRPISIGLYTPAGKIIDSASTRYLVSFVPSTPGKKITYGYREKRFTCLLEYGDQVKININDMGSGTSMIIHTAGSLDSIVFQAGEFSFDRYESFLFNIRAINAQIINKKTGDFLVKQPHRFPLFYEEEPDEEEPTETPSCYKTAAAMENIHGGKNWIKNVCNDEFEEYVHALDSSIQDRIDALEGPKQVKRWTTIYPYKQNTYIRHDFDHDKKYIHTISISTNGCLSWEPLFRITGEWYVYLLYFPGSDQVGIDISNSGVVLLSQNGLSNWKFYLPDLSEEPPKTKIEALVLKNANWSDDLFTKFYFSE